MAEFADRNYEDYLTHKDKERKRNYIARHRKNENWNDFLSPGALSRWILWNKKNIIESVSDYNDRFGLQLK